MKLESVFKDIYGNGCFQITLTLLCSITGLISMFDLHFSVFIVYQPKHITCHTTQEVIWLSTNSLNVSHQHIDPQCHGVLASDPNTTYTCRKWNYPRKMMRNNLLMENDLICDRWFMRTLIQVVYIIGLPVGQTMAMFCDRLGRRTIFLTLLFIQMASSIVLQFSSNLWITFLIVYCKAFTCCLVNIALIQIMELLPTEKRPSFASLCSLGWSLGHILYPITNYFLRDWNDLKCVYLPLSIIAPLLFLLFPKSPRLCLLKSDDGSALKVIHRMIKCNRPTLPPEYMDDLPKKIATLKEEMRHLPRKETLQDSLFHPKLRRHLVYLVVCEILLCFVYFGMSMKLTFISENIYLNCAVLGLAEFPGSLVFWCYSLLCSRRVSMLWISCIGGLLLICTPFIPSRLLAILAGLMAKVALQAAYTGLNLSMTEIIPTSVRTRGFFFCKVISSFFSCLAPVAEAYLGWRSAALLYGPALIICGVLYFLCLPEKYKSPLEDTLVEETKVLNEEKEPISA